MATNLEILREQRKYLFTLLLIKKANAPAEVKELERLIIAAEAEMQQEDVAYIREQVARLPK